MTHRDAVTDIVQFGSGHLVSEQATDFRKSVKIGLKTALRCGEPGCKFKLAAPSIPTREGLMLPPEKLALRAFLPDP